MTVEDQLVSQEGMRLVVSICLVLFYACNGMVGSRDTLWFQGALNMLIGLFRKYGLVENVAKSKSMTCQSGTLRSWISEESVGQQ